MDIRPLGSAVQSANTAPASQHNSSAQAAADATGAPAAQAGEPSASQVAKAVQKINTSPAIQSQGIEFSIDSASHHIVVKVVDQSNNEVIRQIPSKEALAIAESLDESSTSGGSSGSSGLLIKQQA